MKKSLYLFFFSAILMASASPLHDEMCTDSDDMELVAVDMCISNLMVNDPTYQEGYESGVAEGHVLASRRDMDNYRALLRSYSTYASRFPNNVAYHDYFQGKYLGLIDGWENYGSSGTGGLDPIDEPLCVWVFNQWYCEDMN